MYNLKLNLTKKKLLFRIQTCGIGQISPNTILLGWPKVDSDDPDIANNFTSILENKKNFFTHSYLKIFIFF